MKREHEKDLERLFRYIKTFWRNITIMGDDDNECWNWNKSTGNGYGKIRTRELGSGKDITMNAHRYAYLIFIGPIPDNLHCLHICDNRRCCNPSHLFLGTISDNSQDMVKKGRARNGQTPEEIWRKHEISNLRRNP